VNFDVTALTTVERVVELVLVKAVLAANVAPTPLRVNVTTPVLLLP
jgi:hypothetical protein